MNVSHNAKLTSSEQATLWNTYISDTLSICVLKHFLATNQTPETNPILEYALSISKDHLKEITSIFNNEKIPIPNGFNEQDVDLNAQKLWSDTFYLRYLEYMGRTGLSTYALAKAISTRKDLRTLFKKFLDQTDKLFDMVSDLSLEKGVYVRPPYTSYPTKVSYVEDDSFLGGFFGEKRPLLNVEIAHLGTNIEVNNVGKTLLLGFSQVAQSQKLRDYFKKGYDISANQVTIFLETLKKDDTSYPSTWDGEITESTTAPFSDKLLLFHTNMIGAVGIADYGTALSASIRKDLGVNYSKLLLETAQYINEGAKLLIKNGWMEKPPSSLDREELKNKPR
ncbi:DUF3231 family protein [Halobacillus seohaensis]|uniref:DUF3231 family protein n=1 Tax=Halobacillus seohaensis TaxID=447421 RepID=A0ABW2ER31_9BACI